MNNTLSQMEYQEARDTLAKVIQDGDANASMEMLGNLGSCEISNPERAEQERTTSIIRRFGCVLKTHQKGWMSEEGCVQIGAVGQELIDIASYSYWLPQVTFAKSLEVWENLKEIFQMFPHKMDSVVGDMNRESKSPITKEKIPEMLAVVVLHSLKVREV